MCYNNKDHNLFLAQRQRPRYIAANNHVDIEGIRIRRLIEQEVLRIREERKRRLEEEEKEREEEEKEREERKRQERERNFVADVLGLENDNKKSAPASFRFFRRKSKSRTKKRSRKRSR